MAAKKGKVPPQFLPGYKKKATAAKPAKKTRKKSSKKK